MITSPEEQVSFKKLGRLQKAFGTPTSLWGPSGKHIGYYCTAPDSNEAVCRHPGPQISLAQPPHKLVPQTDPPSLSHIESTEKGHSPASKSNIQHETHCTKLPICFNIFVTTVPNTVESTCQVVSATEPPCQWQAVEPTNES